MKALLPMAYVFFILENGVFANGDPVPEKDNYTYRLRELQAKDDDPNVINFQVQPTTDTSTKLIVPRIPGRRPLAHEDKDDIEKEPNNKKKNVKIPSDLEKEIASFQIPIPPKRIVPKKKRKKSAKRLKTRSAKKKSKDDASDVYDVMVDMDDEDDDENLEEEEETEEKKEKFHKLTIKKKRPPKNATSEKTAGQPYRTISEAAQTVIPHRHQHRFTRVNSQRYQPLVVKEIVDLLDPALHPADEVGTRAKKVMPRDVNLIVHTKNHRPRILIRRYKPHFSSLAYPLLSHHTTTEPPVRKKKRRKHRKKRRKIRRPYESSPYSGYQASSCSNNHPLTQPADTYGHDDLSSSSYPLHSSDYSYEPSKFSSLDVAKPTTGYMSNSYDSYVFPSISPSFSEIPFENFDSGDLPTADEYKNEGVAVDEPLPLGYDVNEHENTEQLASKHKQETDETIDDEEEPLQYDDGELDDGNRGSTSDVDYENEAEESLRLISMFGKTTRASKPKPIKKADSTRSLRSQKKIKRI